jgi:hypothetical protein
MHPSDGHSTADHHMLGLNTVASNALVATHLPAQPRRLRVPLLAPRADEPAATAAQFDCINILKVRHFCNPSRFP